VNIIVGNNCTFKTTLLRLLRHAIAYEKNGQFFQSHLTRINFKDDLAMEYLEFENMLTRNAEGDEILANTTSWTPMIGGKEISASDYRKLVKLDFVSTFDVKDTDVNTRETLLDKQLKQLQSDYGYYLNGLLKKFTGNLNAHGNVTKEDYNKIYARKILFENLVNEAFKETGKVIDNEADKLRFIIDGKYSISADKLSSGEKQLLIILLTVLLEDGQEYIMMMDEPEISLHISWQYELLNWILELNPNVQLVLTTHSPSIFSDGWGEKAIYMEDITTRKK
jgi:predicted ATPase